MKKNVKKEESLQDEIAELKRQCKQLKKSLKQKDEEISEIRKENSWLTTAVDITNVGVWDWDFRKEKIVFSPIFSSMMGYAGDRVTDRINWIDMIHPEDTQAIRKKIKRALKDEKMELELQFRMKTKFQGWRWIHSNAKITETDQDKNPVRVIGINSDTTIKSHYEEALRGIQNVTQRIVNTIPDILYIYDLSEERFTYVNEQAVQAFGYNADEFTSLDLNHFGALIHPDEISEYKKDQQRIKKAKDGEIIESTFRIKTVSGSFKWLTSRATVFSRTSEGAAEQVLGIAQDVTDRKEAEETLKSYENRFVKSLISAVEDERKRIARELHGGVIHLLMYANLKLELFQREKDLNGNAELNEVRETILKAGREIRAIVHALHSFVLDNYGLAQSAVQLCSEYEELYKIKFNFDSHGNFEEINRDKELSLYRIMQEALTNIVKHSGATEASVQLFRRNNSIYLVVEDNGKGFEPSQYLSADSKKPSFGLIHMKERTEILDGSFRIESTPGRGTEIHIEIPTEEG